MKMIKLKRFMALFLGVLIIICSIGELEVEVEGKSKKKTKTNNDDDKIIVVSLGDSYSSGEGNIPYGFGMSKEELVNNQDVFRDWAAHRSPVCWAGQLKFNAPGYDEPQSLKDHHYYNADETGNDTIQWYFAAASGAVTDNLFLPQLKFVHQDERDYFGNQTFYFEDVCVLPPQIDIIKKNDLYGKVDYVTCTMGGNNIGFTEIIGNAAIPLSSIIDPNGLENLMIDAWNKFYVPDGVRDQLMDYYRKIAVAVGPQAKIIVVGYPQLIGDTVFFFDKYDKLVIDKNQEIFDAELENIVDDLKLEGLNIEYISVYEMSKNHGMEAYIPWINGITFRSEFTQDPDERSKSFDIMSAISSFSGHPNAIGQKKMAGEVQKYIDSLNGDHSNHFVQSDENKMAYQAYLDYMLQNKENILRYDWHALEGARFINAIDEANSKKNIDEDSNYYSYCMSDNKNRGCSLCDVTGDGFPELFTIQVPSEGENADLHVMKYNSETDELVEILYISDVDNTAGHAKEKSGFFSIAVNEKNIIYYHLSRYDTGINVYTYDETTGLMLPNDSITEPDIKSIAILEAMIFNAPHINVRLEGLNFGECCLKLTTRITGMIPEVRYKNFPELDENIVQEAIYNYIINELSDNVSDSFSLENLNVERINESADYNEDISKYYVESDRTNIFKVDYTDNKGILYHFYVTGIQRSNCPGLTYVDYDNTKESSKYKSDSDILKAIDTGLAFYVQDYYNKKDVPVDNIVSLNDEGYVVFGHYEQDNNASNGPEPIEWEILDENENGKLLISRYVLDSIPYNTDHKEVTWETCTLRSWLNDGFYNSAFNYDEQSLITTVNNENADLVAEGGNDTADKVFCLSLDEAAKYYKFSYDQYSYFGFCKNIITEPTSYAKERGVYTKTLTKDDNNVGYAEAPKGYIEGCIGKIGAAWWLRTSGYFNETACAVLPNGYVGADYEFGVGSSTYGVRPVIWLNVKDEDISKISDNNIKNEDIDNDKDKDNDKEVDKEDEKKNEQKDNEKQENEKKDTEKTKKGKEGWIIENDYKNGKNLFPDSYMNNIDIRVYDSHAYLIYALDYTWEDAKEYCEKLGGHLVTITDDDEQKAVYSYVKSNAPDTDLWIGCSDIQKEGTWKWVTDEKFEYNNFAKGQGAKCSAPAVQDYGAICNGKRSGTVGGVNYSIAAGEWDDLNNGDHTQKGYFICEWDDYSLLKKLIGADSLKIKKSPENKSEGFRLTSKGVFVMDTTLFGCTPAEVEKKIGYDIPDTLEWEFDGPDLKVSWLDGYRGFNIGLFFQNGKLKWCAYSPEGLYWDDKLWQNAQSVYGKGYMDDDNDGHIWIGKNKYRILAYSYNTDSGEKRDVLRQSVYASDFVKN